MDSPHVSTLCIWFTAEARPPCPRFHTVHHSCISSQGNDEDLAAKCRCTQEDHRKRMLAFCIRVCRAFGFQKWELSFNLSMQTNGAVSFRHGLQDIDLTLRPNFRSRYGMSCCVSISRAFPDLKRVGRLFELPLITILSVGVTTSPHYILTCP